MNTVVYFFMITTDGSWQYARKKIFKYPKSGKLIIAPLTQHRGGSFIMDLDNSFNYVGLRVVKRNPDVHGTSYVADVLINSTSKMIKYRHNLNY